MHRPVKVAHSSFIEGSHTTKNTATGVASKYYTRLKIARYNRSSLFGLAVSDKGKKYFDTDFCREIGKNTTFLRI
jgi:hypothetical protein